MQSVGLAVLALAIGAVLGAAVVAAVFAGILVRRRGQVQALLTVPEGVREVLAGMDDTAMVVDGSLTVLASSVPAGSFGIRDGEVLPAEELRELVRTARATATPTSTTLRLRRGTIPSEPRLVAARASVVSDRLTLVVVRDITESARVEQMRRDFVANTSHELKTPVGAVTLLAEAIESAADDPDQVRVFAGRLSAEAARLGSLTSRIMNLSRLQAADELSTVRDVAVDEIVTSAVEAHALQAESAGVELLRGGDRGLYVRGDVQVLSEAVGNLLSNAIAYSPAGASVGIGVREVGGAAEIAVTDRGIGISEADQQRIFERFYRADQARSRSTGGSGLGLSIVKHAVQRHGGEVRLWSRLGRGSTFTISLPLVAAPDDLAHKGRGKKKPKAKKKKAAASPAAAANGESR